MNANVKPMPDSPITKSPTWQLAGWGRREIAIAETEMPALMAIREEYAKSPAVSRARASPARCT